MIGPHWHEGWWSVVVGIAWAAFWIVVILVVVGLVRGRSPGLGAGSPHALRVLEERYARGEISREEFLERRDVLSTGRGRGDTTE